MATTQIAYLFNWV